MSKGEIAKAVAAACGLDRARAAKVVDAVFEWIVADLQTTGRARIPGLGTFRLRTEPHSRPAVIFTPSKALKEKLNK